MQNQAQPYKMNMPPSTVYAVLLALVLGVGCASAPEAGGPQSPGR